MRPFKRVNMLNADEYRVLKRAAASRKIAAGKARRAKIVLLSNQGLTAREIAARLDCNERTALKWIGRFNRHGIAGLEEVLRSGRPRVYGPEDVGAVIQAALTAPQELGLPFASWTLDQTLPHSTACNPLKQRAFETPAAYQQKITLVGAKPEQEDGPTVQK
jgi:hypothetical protein